MIIKKLNHCSKTFSDRGVEMFVTDKNWNRDVRFCSGCEKEVFETKTPEELYNNIELNRCVAMIHEEHTTVGHVTDIDWDDSKSIS